jgi:hypothetical protein
MLYPNIVRKHGVGNSLVIVALAVGAIWLMYFAIGRLINRAVSEELRRRNRQPLEDLKEETGKLPGKQG